MRKVNMENVQEAGDFERLPAGGYVCRYTAVRDNENKEYLEMEFDIAEGKYKGYYKSMYDNMQSKKFWAGIARRSYKESALPFFKRMCSAVAKSNPGFVFDGGKQNADERTLVGKLIGLVLAEEEYTGNDGKTKTRLYVSKECSIFDIRSGNFKVPEIKKLAGSTNAPTATPTPGSDNFVNVPDGVDEECPFN